MCSRLLIAVRLVLILSCVWVNCAIATKGEEFAKSLASFKTLRAEFVQWNPDGTKSSGTVILSLPHRVRVTYQDSGVSLTVNKGMVTYHDSELKETRKLFLSRGDPLLLMLSDIKNLSKYRFLEGTGLFYLEREANGRRFSVVFKEKPFHIVEIIFENESGEITRMTLHKAQYNIALGKDAFLSLIRQNDMFRSLN